MAAAARINGLNGALRRVPVWPFYILGLVPAVAWFRLALLDRLGADPVKVLEHETGIIALQLLIAALAVTPLREVTGVNLLRFRRMLGLMAFAYATIHLSVWLVFDRQLDWPRILEDLVKRPYIILGMAAFLMLVPLAATSWDGAVRRLGATAWRGPGWSRPSRNRLPRANRSAWRKCAREGAGWRKNKGSKRVNHCCSNVWEQSGRAKQDR